MLIRHLKFFITLAEEQHFGRAALACNVTQPTLSQAIRKLEEDLNQPLILRGHRFMALTPEGEKVLHWGRQIVSDYDSLHEDLTGSRRDGLTGTLRLGVIPAAMPSVTLLSEAFSAQNPLAAIEIRAMTAQEIRRALDQFEIDGGLTYLESDQPEAGGRLCHHIPLYREHYVFACRKDHPFAARSWLTWKEAVSQPLCLLTDDMQNRRALNAAAGRAGVSLQPGVVSNSFLGVASHLRGGQWCAVVPHSFGFVFGTEGLALLDLVAPQPGEMVGMLLSARLPQSPMGLALKTCTESAALRGRFQSCFGRDRATEATPQAAG